MIHGGTQSHRRAIKEFFDFCVEQLDIPKIVNIEVDMHLGAEDEYGNCYQIDETNYKINLYGLRVYGFEKVLMTLAHELTHVQQFVYGTELTESEAMTNELKLYKKYFS